MENQQISEQLEQNILHAVTPKERLIFQKASIIKRELADSLRSIRRHYKDLVFQGSKNCIDNWVIDHFYLIEKEGKILLKDLDAIILPFDKKNSQTDVISFIDLCLEDMEFSFTTESLINAVSVFEQRRPMKNFEIEFLIHAMKISAINKIRNCLFGGEQEERLVQKAIELLFDVKSIDTMQIAQSKNLLDKILETDPSGYYPKMNDVTRNLYRYKLCMTAIKKKEDELKLAKDYIEKSQKEDNKHIGFFIYEDYEDLFQKKLAAKIYIPFMFLLPAVISLVFAILFRHYYLPLLLYFPLWAIIKPFVDYFCLLQTEPEYLPRMELNGKIPSRGRTLITIATLLPNTKELSRLKRKLEKLYMTNKTGDVKIALLADLKESEYPTTNEDDLLVRLVKKLVWDLNKQYDNSFILIVRKRSFSKTQQVFTGQERKRGAIETLVDMIMGQQVDLEAFEGNRGYLEQVKYLYVLDYDTKALMDTAEQLVSVALHPLNRPVIDSEKGIVTGGYGILAPRVGIDLKDSLKTPFSKIMGGLGGISAYDKSCGDLYQDLFREGIFAGKGLIDVALFYKVLKDRFPDEVVLSHDILEGSFLRTAFVSDVELLDGFPQSAGSYFKRLHRWIRGDYQNLPYLFSNIETAHDKIRNPLSGLSRFKLFDNLRRELTPWLILRCMMLALFLPAKVSALLASVSVLAVASGFLFNLLWTLLTGGFFTLSRKYYSKTLPITFELLAQCSYELILLPKSAVCGIDAAIRALYRRFISHKKLMEWTTAAQTEKGKHGFWQTIRSYWYSVPIGILFLVMGYGFTRLLGLLFLSGIPLVLYSQKKYLEENHMITEEQSDTILSYTASMWGFYNDYVTAAENYLPPDNVQEAPIYQLAHRTSPTNIGMYLLSVLSARDMRFIDTQTMTEKISHSIDTVEKMKKFHGNLYNWYHTKTLEVLEPQYVSTVDSGNLVCCFVALKEGLLEYRGENEQITLLTERIEALIEKTDLSVFYDQSKKLFSIGYDSKAEKLSPSSYDMLMSEARMTSYFAIAKRQVPVKHWSALGRTLARMNFYTGPLSWTGTMFEYFMPELLLNCIDGSMGYEGLRFCLYCQKRRAKQKGVPFGISESGYYAFDTRLRYQYKAFGVQKLALKKGQNRNTVVSPYSSFLTLPYDFEASYNNLAWLKRIGLYGKYGHYEAIDFTPERVQENHYQIIKSYMAHHIGMSMIAANNALNANVMQQRFMRDKMMNRANELLQEKVIAGSVVFEDIYAREFNRKAGKESSMDLEYSNIYPQSPRAHFLSNGEITSVLTDCGVSFLQYQGKDMTRRSIDLLRRPMGIFALAKTGEQILPFTYAPFYDNSMEYRVTVSENSMYYLSSLNEMQTGMKILLHNTLPCEQRQFVVRNDSAEKKDSQLLFYLEPSLIAYRDDISHPAFSKMFVQIQYDKVSNVLLASRKLRGEEEPVFLAVGFLEEVRFEYEANRENILERPEGIFSLSHAFEKKFGRGKGTPDPCIAIKFQTTILPKSQREYTLLLSSGRTREQAINGIIAVRAEGAMTDETAAGSLMPNDSLEGRLRSVLLPQIVFRKPDTDLSLESVRKTEQHKTALWRFGISGDLPIVLLEVLNEKDIERVKTYLSCHKRMNMCHVEYDLVLSYRDDGEYIKPVLNMIGNQIDKLDQAGMLDASGGIHLVNISGDDSVVHLLRAAACHIAPRSMVRINKPIELYTPIKLNCVSPFGIELQGTKYQVESGAFTEDRFVVEQSPHLPWCHLLANPAFGTLVSDKSLGYTWAVNARENKLTPWSNDTMTDNQGEMLIVRSDGAYYNLTNGAKTEFSPRGVRYSGSFQNIHSDVWVSVHQKDLSKNIYVEFYNQTDRPITLECAYYTEPTLGVDRQNVKFITAQYDDRSLIFRNSFEQPMKAYMGIYTDSECKYTCGRSGFWSGNWETPEDAPNYDPCGVLIVKKELPPRKKEKINFVLGFSASEEGLHQILRKNYGEAFCFPNSLTVQTPDKSLNYMLNTWLPWQTITSRVFSRTGFYQCGGAWGFRDQLQDVANLSVLAPHTARIHIIRAAASQFIEGDVLHWWHNLPKNGGGKKGVRTRCSDDLLWLVYAVCEYIEKTNDYSVLDVPVCYAEAPLLGQQEQDRYVTVETSEIKESVFRHCIRAIDKAYRLGRHRLVLMGSGDWNDGYNRVGASGEGESVWLTQFLALVMKQFAPIAEQYGDHDYSVQLVDTAQKLLEAVEESAWDGEWYLRAFFDDGDKMGSNQSKECKIDSLPQSFSILSGMANRERISSALDSVYTQLVDQDNQLIALFAPAYDISEQNPGYVKAYPIGIRENGGQYTHSAVWYAMATLQSGNIQRGYELLQMLNPAHRCESKELFEKYLAEPYYMVADIYTNPGAYGRGGWSIYTGAAGWYFKTVLEYFLGIQLRFGRLYLHPMIPKSWDGFTASMKIQDTQLEIEVKNTGSSALNDNGITCEYVVLDGQKHHVIVEC